MLMKGVPIGVSGSTGGSVGGSGGGGGAGIGNTYCVSVIGMSSKASEAEVKGVGKSCLCNRFVRPGADNYRDRHSSIVSEPDFAGQVLRSTHWIYWGTGQLSQTHQLFHIVEQTEIANDANLKVFSYSEPYVVRCTATKLYTSQKLAWICWDQLGFEDDYPKVRAPDGALLINGFVICFDGSANFERQCAFLKELAPFLAKAKRPCVLAVTKMDLLANQSTESHGRQMEALRKAAKPLANLVGTVETSAHLGVNVDEAFRLLAGAIEKNRLRPTPYAEALSAHQAACESANLGFRESLIATLSPSGAFQQSTNRAAFDAWLNSNAGRPEVAAFVALFGTATAEREFDRFMTSLRDRAVAERRGVIRQRLGQLLEQAYPLETADPSRLQRHDSVVKRLLQIGGDQHFVSVTNAWHENRDYLASLDSRIPYNFLINKTETGQLFSEHRDRVLKHQRREILKSQLLASLRESPSCLAGAASLEDLGRLVPQATLQTAIIEHGLSELLAALPDLQAEGRRLALAEVQEWLLERPELVPVFESNPTDEDVRRAAKLMKRDLRCSGLLQLLRTAATPKAKDLARAWLDLPNEPSGCHLRPCADFVVPEAITEHRRGHVSVPQLLLLGQPQLIRQFKRACRHLRQQPGYFQLVEGAPPLQVDLKTPTLAQLRAAAAAASSNPEDKSGGGGATAPTCILLYSGEFAGSLDEARAFVNTVPALREAATAYEEESTYECLGPGSPAHNQLTQQQPPTPPQQQQSQQSDSAVVDSRFAVCCLSSSTDAALLGQGRQLAASIRGRHFECQQQSQPTSLPPQPPSHQRRQSPSSDEANSSTSSSPIGGRRGGGGGGSGISDNLRQLAEDCLTHLLPAAVEAAASLSGAAAAAAAASSSSSSASIASAASAAPSSTLLIALVCGDPDLPGCVSRLLAALPLRRSAHQLQRAGHDALIVAAANSAAISNGSGGSGVGHADNSCMLLRLASFHRAWRILRFHHQQQQQQQQQLATSQHQPPTSLLIVFNASRRASINCAKQFATAVASGPRTPYLLVNVGFGISGATEAVQLDDPQGALILSDFVANAARSLHSLKRTIADPPMLQSSPMSARSYYLPCSDDPEPQYYTPLGDGEDSQLQLRRTELTVATMPEVYASPPDSVARPGGVLTPSAAAVPLPDSTYTDACNAMPLGAYQMVGSARAAANAAAAAAAAAAAGSVNQAFTGDELEARSKAAGSRGQLRHKQSRRAGAAPPAIGPLSWSRLQVEPSSGVPFCITACAAYIEANGGLNSEGVYRVGGNAYEIADTVVLLLTHPNELATVGPCLFAVTSALKQIVGKLTPPVLPELLLSRLIPLCQSPAELGGLLRAELDSNQQACLRRLAQHLNRLAKAASVTKMTSANLALCWAPTLMPFSDPMVLLANRDALQCVVETIIDHPEMFD